MAEIELGGYLAVVEGGALGSLGQRVSSVAAGVHRWAVITDENVAARYGREVASTLGGAEVITIPAGERHKTRETWARVTDQMLAAGLGRDAGIVALGGGMVGDLAGFVAATYMRGIPFVQVPTTLLAMVDASVGGKTGVDTPAGKNLVGAFHPPILVLVDPRVLRTLPLRERRAGIAEVIKHGVVADETYFEEVTAALPGLTAAEPPEELLTRLIARSIAIKGAIVARDERESGLRKVLNFGHTIGHAIEAVSGYMPLHGEAVAIGMVVESELAGRLRIAGPETAGRVHAAVEAAGLPTTLPPNVELDTIVTATHADKKARRGAVEYALPRRIGAMAGAERGWSIPVGDEVVREVLGGHATA